MKKFLSGLLSLVMVLSLTTTAFATDITIAGSDSEVPVELTQAASEFSVTVPTVLPVDVDADGVVTVATDNKIINNSWGAVQIKSVSVESLNDWTLVEFDTDFYTKAVGIKEYGLQLNEVNVATNGSADATTFDPIEGHSEISFTYDANIGARKNALSGEQIAQVIFVIGWYDGSGVIGGGSTSTYSGAGFYQGDHMLIPYEDSGLDIVRDYDSNTYNDNNIPSACGIIRDRYPTTTKIVISDNITKIGAYAFCGANTTDTVVIPNSVESIGKAAFKGCRLSSVTIPGSIKIIAESAFTDCPYLSTLVIENGVEIIKNAAFRDIDSLTTIFFPKSLTTLESGSFYDCEYVSNIYYEGTEEEWNALIENNKGWNSFMGSKVDGGTTIHYNYQG